MGAESAGAQALGFHTLQKPTQSQKDSRMADDDDDGIKAWIELIARQEAPDADCKVENMGDKVTLRLTNGRGQQVSFPVRPEWDENDIRSAVRQALVIE
jgi:hypothetical protein